MTSIERVLGRFGLTQAEQELFLTLLRRGEATASELSHQSGLNRTFVYDRLKKLLESGLVSHVTKDHKKYFRPILPTQLLSLARQRVEEVELIVPELERLQAKEPLLPRIEIFSSKKGIQTVLTQLLEPKKEMRILGSFKNLQKTTGDFFDVWNARRMFNDMPIKLLSNEPAELERCSFKYFSDFENDFSTFVMVQDKVAIFWWNQNQTAILIEGKEMADNYQAFFNRLWENDVNVYTGVEGVHRAFLEMLSPGVKETYWLGLSAQLAKIYTLPFAQEWQKKRIALGISEKTIAYDDEKTRNYYGPRSNQFKEMGVRYLDKRICGPACISFSEKLVVTFLYTEKKYRVIVSRDPETISIYKKHFEALWKMAKP